MSVAMKLEGVPLDGVVTPYDGQYVKEWNATKDVLVTTTNILEAKRYPSIIEAREDWMQVDQRHPLRPDGRPNRPLTGYSITFDPIPEGVTEVWMPPA